jgi:NodT family efflux transporter outer membrane factor (OMF) lipoprotein
MSVRHISLAAAILAVLAGCAVTAPPAPEQIRKDALQGAEIRTSWSADAPQAGAVSDNWLASFNDPQLNALVDEALQRNPDLRATAARVEQSAAYAQIARAALLPAINLLGTGGLKVGGGSDLTSALQGVMLGVSWEPDLWGRLRYGRNAADASYASAQADYEFARQSMAAQVARSWFLATEAMLQLAATESMAQSSRELLRLAEDREKVGIGSQKDVVLARANLGLIEDGVRQARLAHEQSIRSLETLLGRYPAAELRTAPELPPMPAPIPVGMPLDMLERRPDVIAAERRVAAAFNRAGEARAAQLPRIRLNASVSALDSEVLELQDDFENPSGGAGATLVAPLYQGGALRAQVSVRTAEQKEALARYASQVLRGINEVENALAASRMLSERMQLLDQVVKDQKKTLEYDQAAYRIGRQDLRSVQQQQQQVQSARIALLRVQSEQLIQRVNLHLALGGSFAEPMTVAAARVTAPAPVRPARRIVEP